KSRPAAVVRGPATRVATRVLVGNARAGVTLSVSDTHRVGLFAAAFALDLVSGIRGVQSAHGVFRTLRHTAAVFTFANRHANFASIRTSAKTRKRRAAARGIDKGAAHGRFCRRAAR